MTLNAVIKPVVPLNLLFPHQRVICPHSRLSAKYIIVTHNFTNDDLTDGYSPSYQSLVNIPPGLLRSPLRPTTEETPVPTTWTLSSVPVLPAEPAPFSISTLKTARSQRENFLLYRSQSKSQRPVPVPSLLSPPSTDHSEGARTASLSPQGERVAAGGNHIPPRRP